MNLFEMFDNSKKLTLINALEDFLPLAMEQLGITKLPKITFKKDVESSRAPTFGRFTNDSKVIFVDIENRHPNDILRTLAHELTHFAQNERGELDAESGNTGSDAENEANAVAGVIMRHFNQAHPEYLKLKPIMFESTGHDEPEEQGIDPRIEETYDGDEFYEAYGEMWFNEDEQLDEAEYRGRKVPLGKPMQGDVKKFKVYVKDPKTGNVKKVNFGDPNMRIKKSNPARRRSFRARHNCANPGPRTKARYWSCRKW